MKSILSVLALFSLCAAASLSAARAVYVIPAENRVRMLDEQIPTSDFLWSARENVIKLAGAGGERLRFQVVAAVERDTLRQVCFKWGELKSGESVLPASALKPFLAALVRVYAPSGKEGSTGWFQDPLAPLAEPLDIFPDRWKSRKDQTFWLELDIPRGQKPGVYAGALDLVCSDSVLSHLPLRLTVYPFDLPSSGHLFALFNCSKGWLGRYYTERRLQGRSLDDVLAQYFDFMLDRGIQPWFNPLLQPKTTDKEDGLSLEWPNPELEKHFLNHPSYLRVTFPARPRGLDDDGEEGGENGLSPAAARKVQDWVGGIYEHYKANGWLDKLTFFGPIDEPNSRAAYEELIRWGKLVHAAAPGAGYQVTEQPLPQETDWPPLSSVATDWVVHGSNLESNRDEITRLIGQGQHASWYISCDQLYPMANYFIDMSASDSRAVAWITRRYGMQGILYWAVNYWTEVVSPWRDPVTWKRSECNSPLAGEGSLLYPGEEIKSYCGQPDVAGPVSSVRFEMLHKGMQDVEYLFLLDSLGRKADSDRLCRDMVISAGVFSREPERYEQVKAEAARLIAEALKKGKGKSR